MKVEFDVFAGFIHIRPENETEQAEIYKFYVETSCPCYQEKFTMTILEQSEADASEVENYPTLSFGNGG